MHPTFTGWRPGNGLKLALLLVFATSAGVMAQEPAPPQIIQQTPTVPGPVGEMSYISDRALIAPNMFGDILGTRPFSIFGVGGGTGAGAGGGTTTRQVSGFIIDNMAGKASYLTQNGTTTLTPSAGQNPLTYLGVTVPDDPFTSKIPIAGPTNAPIFETLSVSNAIRAALAKPGETMTFNSASMAVHSLDIGDGFQIYNIFLVYDFTLQQVVAVTLVLPNPTDGGLVGRNRVSTNSSPVPRDRFIFNYDFVHNTGLYPGAGNMNRMVVGFEKTFLDGLFSVEFRAPFASTVASSSHDNGVFGSGRGEFGNLFLLFKGLIFANDRFLVSGGLGVSIPTADDVVLGLAGTDLAKINNDAVIVSPFLAALWTPTDRAFAQTWLSCGIDSNGNTVSVNPDGKGLQSIGRLYDPTALQFDAQIGYWLIHPGERTGAFRGLAPFFEVHYSQQTTSQNSVSQGAVSVVTSNSNRLSEINLSAGAAVQLYNNINVMFGASAPVGNPTDRFSDWQIGLRFNYFFGPTGRAIANMY